MKKAIIISIILLIMCHPVLAEVPGKIFPLDGQSNDCFGYAVSISGDFAIIGAYIDDERGINSGSAYIYQQKSNVWELVQKIVPTDGFGGDHFGYSVSISGDYVIIGSPYDDDNASNSGSAYIYKRNADEWEYVAKLTPNDGAQSDYFGYAVAIYEDIAIVSAPSGEGKTSYTGSAYIYQRNGDTWNYLTKIFASDGASSDQFGFAVSITNEYAIIGAYNDNDKGGSSGAAYIFQRNGTYWNLITKKVPSDGQSNDYFGYAVSMHGDYAIIGAYGNDEKFSNSGSAYIYQRSETYWNLVEKLVPDDGNESFFFGRSVSIYGNYAIIGASGDDDRGSNSGSAYIYQNIDSNWQQVKKVVASDSASNDNFGFAVALSEKYAIVGSPYDDEKSINSGSAYIYKNINNTECCETWNFSINAIRNNPISYTETIQLGLGCQEYTEKAVQDARFYLTTAYNKDDMYALQYQDDLNENPFWIFAVESGSEDTTLQWSLGEDDHYYQLRESDSGIGKAIIWDMKETNSFKVTASAEIQYFTIHRSNNKWPSIIRSIRAHSEPHVIFGIESESYTLEAIPFNPPEYATSIVISPNDYLMADVRQEGINEFERWVIEVNPKGEYGLSSELGTCTLNWEPESFIDQGTFRILEGWEELNTQCNVVVKDMRTTTSFEVSGFNSKQYFTILWSRINHPPVISDIADQYITDFNAISPIQYTVFDSDCDQLIITATSSDETVVPTENIVFSGSGTNRTINITPEKLNKETTINITASDGLSQVSTNFKVQVKSALLYFNTKNKHTLNQTVDIPLEISNVTDLGGFELKILYDPELMSVNSVTLGDFLGSSGRSTNILINENDNLNGIILFGVMTIPGGPEDGASGNGEVLVMNVSTLKAGSTGLSLTEVQLSDTVGNAIDIAQENQSMIIVDPAYLSFSTPEYIPVNQTVDIPLEISNVTDLGGFELKIFYDPELMSVNSVTLGDFLASSGRTTNILYDDNDDLSGIITYAAMTFSGPEGATGNGEVLIMNVTPIKAGSTGLTLTELQFVDTVGNELYIASENQSMTIGKHAYLTFSAPEFISVGETIASEVMINDVIDCAGYEINLKYSGTDSIIANSNTNGSFLSGALSIVNSVETEGEIGMAYAAIGESKSGNGELFTTSWTGLSPGVVTIRVETLNFSDSTANRIDVIPFDDFSITIVQIPIPDGITISNTGPKQINLKWNSMGADMTYNLYKSLSQDGSYIKCNDIELRGTEFVDTDVVENTQYWYKIKSVNTFGKESLFSDAISTTTPDFPIYTLNPEGLFSNSHSIDACNTNQTISIKWTAPEGVEIDGYSILWDHSPNTLPDKNITTTDLNHNSPYLSESNDHFVHIRVVDDQGRWSNVAAHLGPFCIDLPDIPIPAGLDISNNSQLTELTWWYTGGLKYNVYKSDSENGFFIKCDPYELTEPKYVDTDVVEGNQYWYKITAVNDLGEESLFSDVVSAKIEPVEGGSFQLISHQPYQMQMSGLSTRYQIQLIPEGGYSDDVVLSVNGLPDSFLTATFNNNHIGLPGFAILTVDIFNNVPEKQYSFNVSAHGYNRLEEIPLFLDVTNPPSGDSVISAYVSHSQVNLHQSFDIYGSISPKGIYTRISIYVKHESGQEPAVFETKTDHNKSYKYTCTLNQTGKYIIYARWESDSMLSSSESPRQTVTVFRGKSRLTCQTPDTNVSSDNRVRITGKLLKPSIGDTHIILRIKDPDGKLKWIENKIFTDSDGNYRYSVILDQEGIWEISSCWEGNDQYLGSISYPLRLYPGLKAGKALIVAGGGLANNTLWPTTQYLTKQFYKILLKRHFTQQLIYYISPDINHQNNDIVINDKTPQVSDIDNYIKSLYENISQPDVNEERPFLLYLADHGGNQSFKVNHGKEILKAQDLDLWLDNLQKNTHCAIFIIIEACYSGSFVDVLSPSSDQKRVIMTSAGNNDQSFSNGDGRLSFSRYVLNELGVGNNLYVSFENATAKMEKMSLFNKQIPQIDYGQDGNLAKKSYIGGTFLISDILPEIIDHTPMQTLVAGPHELFMDISDVEGIDRAWVSIMPPHFHIPESTNDFETPIIDLPIITLNDDEGNGHYSGIYDSFAQNGVYHVTFHCEDIGGNVVSKEVLLNVIDGQIPGDLDNNGKVNLCDAIISMKSNASMAVLVQESPNILCSGSCQVIKILQMMAGMK